MKKLGKDGEKYWAKAKSICNKEYSYTEKDGKKLYKCVTGITKKMAGTTESSDVWNNILELVENGASADQLIDVVMKAK